MDECEHGDRYEGIGRSGLICVACEANALRKSRDEIRREYETVMDLLRTSRRTHGRCQPRERLACSACNANDMLTAKLAAWKGVTLTADDLQTRLNAMAAIAPQ